MAKKMYIIQAEDGMFFCGMRHWDKQLRKAKIYHSLEYAKDVIDAYEKSNCKIVEVSLAIVPESKTNADRIRAMSDEELAKAIASKAYTGACNDFDIPYDGKCCHNCEKCDAIIKWLRQPAEMSEESDHGKE